MILLLVERSIFVSFNFWWSTECVKFNKFNNSQSYHIGHMQKKKKEKEKRYSITLFTSRNCHSRSTLFSIVFVFDRQQYYFLRLFVAISYFVSYFHDTKGNLLNLFRGMRHRHAKNGDWFEGTLRSRSVILIKKLSTNSKRCSDGINENSLLPQKVVWCSRGCSD